MEEMKRAGGRRLSGPFGFVYAPNITSHPDAGIGAYSGTSKTDHSAWAMPWSAARGLTDSDLEALIAALRNVPPNASVAPARPLNPRYENETTATTAEEWLAK